MRDAIDSIIQLGSEHSLIFSGLVLVFLLVVVLGVLHVIRVFGRILLVLIDEVKHETSGIRVVYGEVRSALKADASPAEGREIDSGSSSVVPHANQPSRGTLTSARTQ
jgi:hypothetical protein